MYGRIFECLFTGSMVGAGVHVFAVWAYALAHVREGMVEINPRLVAAILGTTTNRVQKALEYLQQPDPDSRFTEHNGQRLIHQGAHAYLMPAHEHYQKLATEKDRREYMRNYMREYRNEKQIEGGGDHVTDVTDVTSNEECKQPVNICKQPLADVSPSDAVSVPDSSTEKEQTLVEKPSFPTCPTVELLQAWNEKATELGLPTVRIRTLAKSRARKLQQRWKEWGSTCEEAWATFRDILEIIDESPHLLGENDRGWKASLDFVTKDDSNWQRIVEGAYKGKQEKDYGTIWDDGS